MLELPRCVGEAAELAQLLCVGETKRERAIEIPWFVSGSCGGPIHRSPCVKATSSARLFVVFLCTSRSGTIGPHKFKYCVAGAAAVARVVALNADDAVPRDRLGLAELAWLSTLKLQNSTRILQTPAAACYQRRDDQPIWRCGAQRVISVGR